MNEPKPVAIYSVSIPGTPHVAPFRSCGMRVTDPKTRAVTGSVIVQCGDFDAAGVWKADAYVSAELTDPTWLDILRCADEAIAVTGDDHHIFLEGIETVASAGGTTIVNLQMGS